MCNPALIMYESQEKDKANCSLVLMKPDLALISDLPTGFLVPNYSVAKTCVNSLSSKDMSFPRPETYIDYLPITSKVQVL